MKEKPSYYAILTAEVRYAKNLTMFQKILYAEMTALSEKEGFCWASNKYFAELYDKSEKYISSTISDMNKKGYIDTFISQKDGITRKIYIGATHKNLDSYPEKSGETYPEKPEHNTTSINTKKEREPSYEDSSVTYKTKQKIYKQRGLEYKPKKSRFIEVGKVVEEFRAAASARGFNLLKSDGQRNKRIRGQIEALLIAGKDLKGLINWWFKGEGDYCGYAPENLFTERTVETYHVKNKKKEVKDTTPDFQKLKEKWKSQNKNQRKRS
jgi:hypothetical protein